MKQWLQKFNAEHPRWAEVIRFVIVGGVATVADMLMMGVVMYWCQPDLYPHFYHVFIGNYEPSTLATVLGTGVGFVVGLIVNYVASVLFVFQEKGNSKTVRGFILFAVLSMGGLAIHLVGMYLFYDLAHWNEWIIKIVLTIVVLFYNYLTRKFLVFKKQNQQQKENE